MAPFMNIFIHAIFYEKQLRTFILARNELFLEKITKETPLNFQTVGFPFSKQSCEHTCVLDFHTSLDAGRILSMGLMCFSNQCSSISFSLHPLYY